MTHLYETLRYILYPFFLQYTCMEVINFLKFYHQTHVKVLVQAGFFQILLDIESFEIFFLPYDIEIHQLFFN